MSVESGVGVACGCLPGCKPLMNRMFPRIFTSTTQSSSRPSRRPGAAKNIDSTGASESYAMQSLRDGGEGVVIDEKRNANVGVNEGRRQEMEMEMVREEVERSMPPPPPPSRQERRTSRLAFSRSGRRYGELDGSDGSSDEMIILQRGSVDERYTGWRGDRV
jgi:hypothetical protein